MRGNASFGTVAGTSEPVALKSPGAGSSLLSSKGFSATAGPANVLIRTDSTSVVSYINLKGERRWICSPEREHALPVVLHSPLTSS